MTFWDKYRPLCSHMSDDEFKQHQDSLTKIVSHVGHSVVISHYIDQNGKKQGPFVRQHDLIVIQGNYVDDHYQGEINVTKFEGIEHFLLDRSIFNRGNLQQSERWNPSTKKYVITNYIDGLIVIDDVDEPNALPTDQAKL